jgi:predicted GNAT superfamily acetyltransferase
MSDFKIRSLHTLDHIDQVVALQRGEWDDPTTVVYPHMLISLVHNGGSLIGALDGERVIGFVLGYLGIDATDGSRPAMANLKLCSLRMTVLPEYRNSGLGYQLKLAQRQYAIQQGLRLVTWTFDPLNSRNAHLNIRKLGCVIQDYVIDYYGKTPSPLVTQDQSDRVVAEWRVNQNRVENRLSGKRPPLSYEQYLTGNATLINPTTLNAAGLPEPGALQPIQSLIGLLEIPSQFNAIVNADEGLARTWRAHTREVFTTIFRAGYFVTDFVHTTTEGRERSFYVISSAENGSGFSAN